MRDPTIHPNDEGLDGIDRHKQPVDEGLASWAKVVQSSLQAQQGVEIIDQSGNSVHFKFRGQFFAVHVHRSS